MEDLIRCPKYNCQQSESNLNIAVLYTSALVRICHPILSLYHKETFGHMMPQERSAQSSEYITKDTIWLLKERTTIHPTTLRTSHCTLHHSLRATAWLNEREHLLAQANTFNKQMKLPCLHSRILPLQRDEKCELAPPGMLNSMHIIIG